MMEDGKILCDDNGRSLLDLTPNGMCVLKLKPEPIITYANYPLLQFFQARFTDIVGRPLRDIWPYHIPDEVASALTHRTRLSNFDFQLFGEDVPLWARITIVHTSYKGEPTAIMWAADITSIKDAEREARIVGDMKSSFLATMSHEIRTPMQSVFGLLELINDENVSPHVKEMVATARKSASGLLEILDDILDLAKVEAGKVELDSFETPVRTLAYGVLECLGVRLMGKNIQLTADISEDVPFVMLSDPIRLRQILINLIGNSIKFTDSGTVTLRIRKKTQHVPPPRGGMALRFEIIDTGIGMEQDVANRLFQPFTQADNSTRRKFGGTGLGLSISHKLIELMGGKIGVISQPGKGSTFWFEIPTYAAPEQSNVELPNLEGLAVLSVEDHPKGAKEILSSLASMGAKIESVPTYKEGLELIQKRPFDVAIIDQGLPDGQGIDLLREAVKLRPFMGLILYTVHDDYGIQYSAKALGAKYLSKPASRFGLGEAVKSAAKQRMTNDYTGPNKLLIAEDTPAIQDLLRRQLAKLGAEADFVSNGAEALRALEKNEYGILFTDLHMPDMDGYQLVAAIRAQEEKDNVDTHRRFPVIVLTADVQLAQRQTYLSYGFDECLLKPVSLGQFRQLLIRWGVLKEANSEFVAPPLPPPPVTPAPTPATLSTDLSALPPAIDKQMILEQVGVFDDSIIEMLRMFIDMTKEQITEIEASFKNGASLHHMKELAHSLKGAARSAGCRRLGDLAGALQDKAENKEAISPTLIQEITQEFARVDKEIETLRV